MRIYSVCPTVVFMTQEADIISWDDVIDETRIQSIKQFLGHNTLDHGVLNLRGQTCGETWHNEDGPTIWRLHGHYRRI